MATNFNLAITITILSFFIIFTFSQACDPCVPKPKPKSPSQAPVVKSFCPKDALKFSACAGLLGTSISLGGGSPTSSKCCSLLQGLSDFEAAACLCTAIKANVLGINLNMGVSLSAIVSGCGKTIPPGFKCK